jgi:hypothetical protein
MDLDTAQLNDPIDVHAPFPTPFAATETRMIPRLRRADQFPRGALVLGESRCRRRVQAAGSTLPHREPESTIAAVGPRWHRIGAWF